METDLLCKEWVAKITEQLWAFRHYVALSPILVSAKMGDADWQAQFEAVMDTMSDSEVSALAHEALHEP